MDLKHADSILIMGSNMAECHPVAFRWVMQARTRPNNPATVIHADPRFTRTSAMANIYAPVRAGSDIVFLGALIHYVLEKHAHLVGKKRVNHTLAIASLGGATMDNEWNYLQGKLMRALGVVAIENQARI